MRTVDPKEWSKYIVKAPLSRRFGQSPKKGLEQRLRRSFYISLKEYILNCHIGGLRLGYDKSLSRSERIFWRWLLVLFIATAAATLFLLVYWQRSAPALVVSLPSLEHSVSDIDFPAVALCDYNVVSKTKAEEVARTLYEKAISKHMHEYSYREIYRYMVSYGNLNNLHLADADVMGMNSFMEALDEDFVTNATKVFFEKLTQPCSQKVKTCAWGGRIKPCSEMFAKRITSYGVCCVFNGRYQSVDRGRTAHRLSSIGKDNGLYLVLRGDEDDYTVSRRPIIGSEVMLFEGSEFPLAAGGATRSYPVMLNRSTYLVLSASHQGVADNVWRIDEERRGCRTIPQDTSSQPAGGFVTCLAECRREAARQLCGCVPYQLMPPEHDTPCSIINLQCLNKYKEKLLRYYPNNAETEEGLGEELADSLYCPQCIPDCVKTRYTAKVYSSKYSAGRKLFRNYFSQNVSVVNSSVIRIFFSTEAQTLFAVEVNERWYEITAMVGSQGSLLLGITILAIPELIFFFTLRWRENYRKLY